MAVIDDLRQKTLSELKKEAVTVREEIARLRWDLSLGKLKDTSKIRKPKKRLAQILTVIKQKDILKENQ